MDNYNEGLTRRAIRHALELYTRERETDREGARKPKASELFRARFEEFTIGLHFLLQAEGISPGAAPTAVEIDIIEAIRANGQPPARGMAHNDAYVAWLAAVAEDLVDRWAPKAVAS